MAKQNPIDVVKVAQRVAQTVVGVSGIIIHIWDKKTRKVKRGEKGASK